MRNFEIQCIYFKFQLSCFYGSYFHFNIIFINPFKGQPHAWLVGRHQTKKSKTDVYFCIIQSAGFVGPYISRNCSESMNKNMFEKKTRFITIILLNINKFILFTRHFADARFGKIIVT